ncbi:DUF4856 domain-containing protein [Jiulongibacter sp. NS-SX5]|uniref:DUF4856 domain-containing protein n=1 Tax=Jiulongibacter sp. NS-SX5 TaxID=3463854 RepID=UPI004058A260
MRNYFISGLALVALLSSCDTGNDVSPEKPELNIPETYSFSRNGESTVSYSGQTTRLQMAAELTSAMSASGTSTAETLVGMYRNQGGFFANADLNASDKSVKSKVAASADFFANNPTESTEIQDTFETLLYAQVDEVFPNWNTEAAAGVAGQFVDGTSVRHVNALGLEYDQMVAKSLIGALTLDQIVNNYVSVNVLDAGSNVEDNNNLVLADGKPYTTMEHKWDEAYGYLFGGAADGANPLPTLGSDDSFLNKYLKRVEDDPDFAGIAQTIFDAFKTGRAAIVAQDYDLRDQQAEIIRENLSKVVAVRAIHYFLAGKQAIENGEDREAAFHDLSEGLGFVYSLRFTRKPNSTESYLPAAEVNAFIAGALANNGFWDVTPEFLDQVALRIGSAFGIDPSLTIN